MSLISLFNFYNRITHHQRFPIYILVSGVYSNRNEYLFSMFAVSLYEKSHMIAMFIIIFTSFMRYLQKLSTDPPAWVSNGTTLILRSRVGQILLINILNPAATAKIEADADDNTDLMPSDGKKMPWGYVTMLVGRLAFLTVLLTYIVLLSMYLPTYHRIN